jgi:hypothetical protein
MVETFTHHTRRSRAPRQQKSENRGRMEQVRLHNNGSTRGANGENNMSAYLISYDLDKPGQDYTDLINAIKKLGDYKVLFSEWIVKTNYSAEQIHDYLRKFMDGNDRLLVVGLSGEAAWTNVMISNQAVEQLLAA